MPNNLIKWKGVRYGKGGPLQCQRNTRAAPNRTFPTGRTRASVTARCPKVLPRRRRLVRQHQQGRIWRDTGRLSKKTQNARCSGNGMVNSGRLMPEREPIAAFRCRIRRRIGLDGPKASLNLRHRERGGGSARRHAGEFCGRNAALRKRLGQKDIRLHRRRTTARVPLPRHCNLGFGTCGDSGLQPAAIFFHFVSLCASFRPCTYYAGDLRHRFGARNDKVRLFRSGKQF